MTVEEAQQEVTASGAEMRQHWEAWMAALERWRKAQEALLKAHLSAAASPPPGRLVAVSDGLHRWCRCKCAPCVDGACCMGYGADCFRGRE